jgi:hypothetical protein
MSDKPAVGGTNYRNALKGLREERARLLKLVEQLALPEVSNGNRQRLRAETLAVLIRMDEHLLVLDEIGQAARQERKER